MMNFFYNDALYALILSNAVLVFGAAMALIRFERLLRRERLVSENPIDTSVQAHSNSEAVLVGRLERRLVTIHEKVDRLTRQKVSTVATQGADLPYEYAARMAKQGASIYDLTRACGLNKAQAQLIWRLHARHRKARTRTTH